MKQSRRDTVFARDNYRCIRCGTNATAFNQLTIDHILPKSRGGTNDLDNLQTLCEQCNQLKADDQLSSITVYTRIR